MTTPNLLLRSAWKFFRRGLALMVFLVAYRPVLALDADKDLTQCRMDTWTTRDGLPPREIESMAQTQDGYLWLATRAGLTRFDGITFTVYDVRNTPGFTRGMVSAVAVDKSGDLWVGTDGDGFGTFRDGVYTRCRAGAGVPHWSVTRTICPASDGSVWVGGEGDDNLARVQGGRVQVIPTAPAEIYAIVEAGDGSLWLACGRYGLIRRRPDGTFLPCLNSRKELLYGAASLCLDRERTLWIGCDQKGLYRVRADHAEQGEPASIAVRGKTPSLCADGEGGVWCGSQDTLFRERAGAWSAFGHADGLTQGRVGAMLFDREGNLWAATGARLTRFNNTKLTPYLPACVPAATVRALAQTPNGDIWIGTTQGLIRQRQGVPKPLSLPAGVAGHAIGSLWTDRKGVLWIATQGGDLLSFDNERFHRSSVQGDEKGIADDANGTILRDWKALYRLRGDKCVLLSSLQETGYIFAFYRDKQHTLWFGSEKGLGRIRKDRVEIISKGLPANTHVLSVTGDSNGNVWAGTDKGLAHWAHGKFTLFTVHDGLPDDNLYQIALTNQGTLWLGGNRGIFSVKPADINAYTHGNFAAVPNTLYDAADGIRQFPLAPNGALKMQNGAIWFQGEMGVTIVDPHSIALNKLVPTVKIERVTLDGKTLPSGSADLVVAPGKGELEIRYTGLSLTVPEKVRFHYQLEGFDPDWVDAGQRRAAYYTNLPPGNYRFRVMACNNDGYWNSKGATLTFTLQPRFYQTASLRILFALAIGGVCACLAWLRLHKLRLANRRLEARIGERTTQLLQANRELHAACQSAQEANTRLRSLAITDGMTGLANHRAFQETLQTALVIAELNAQPLALLLADVDHFKQYNDAYGHPAGDEVLRVVARVLQECARNGDIVARYGGEEFAILLPDSDTQAALEVGEQVRAAIADGVFPCRSVTMSIGCAALTKGDYAAQSLIRRADEALYAAKRGGRNRVMLATRHADSIGEEQVETEDAGGKNEQTLVPALALTLDTLSATRAQNRRRIRPKRRQD